MKDRLIHLAREAGFPVCAFAALSPVQVEGTLHPQAQTLTGEAQSLLPEGKCVLLLAMPYRPFGEKADAAQVDAYYISSNAAHEAAQLLAKRIEETLGLRALASPPIYLKPLFARSGLGEFGRNGLISIGAYGTRVCLQAILLDADIPCSPAMPRALAASCAGCRACLQACPTGALIGDGSLDIARCLRAQPENEPFPEAMRPQLKGSILGCDICQRVCPRNAQVKSLPEPDGLSAALDLNALLSGQYKPLIPFLGKNNARRQRLTARALIAAANLHRRDLLPLIEPLTECKESEMVRIHARWAMNRLTEPTEED